MKKTLKTLAYFIISIIFALLILILVSEYGTRHERDTRKAQKWQEVIE